MILLDKSKLKGMNTTYVKIIMNRIQLLYDEALAIGNLIISNGFNSQNVITLFQKCGTADLDEELIKTLLLDPIEETCGKYLWINNYVLTCKFIHYAPKEIDKYLELLGLEKTKANREEVRRNHIRKYSNGWINGIVGRYPDYYRSNDTFKDLINYIENVLGVLNENISTIIDYELIDQKMRHEILYNMGVEVCPYCNRQYITNYEDEKAKKSTADLDHFLPKSVFQLLSLSLYNFVPSCPICNSRFKLSKCKEILDPYDESFEDDAWFAVVINDKSDVNTLLGKNDNFDLIIEVDNACKNAVKIKNSIEIFSIENVYQSHKQYVRELLYKKNVYSKTYKKQMEELFKTMKLDEHEIDLFLYGNFLRKDWFTKRPLSKLAFDVVKRDS